MFKITNIKVLNEFVLQLTFNDGESKKIDFKPFIGKGVSAALLDKEFFNTVRIDDGGGIEWSNGMDFCPNFLKEFVDDIKQKDAV